ncbi:type II secretion system protein [Desulfuromonas thiophila]|uniref:Prepilin-type N-terminal cleavage/methylation domain-containing protein n=1 Tax=Desulfuromonas thiophila TaxID=57664 RepID=A0A1G6X118_9BACT|nr:type II secretion system protein [Desulfuromonas thiophila]SDD71791.1 prepilin-type N-terminal cleavage/methylation domain-containing protein [Desulfuromonas thiophila]
MKAVLLKKLRRLQAQQGFTLLEILVVLTIMGFLIAMVAPRLAGISGGAVDTVCDSNQNRMVSYLGAYFEKTNRFPDKLTNLVSELATADTYTIPAVSDDDPENGPETLASEFMGRNHFRIHYLNAKEVAELKGMGIVNLFNLNAYEWMDDAGTLKAGYDAAGTNPTEVAFTAITAADQKPSMEQVALKTAATTGDVLDNPIAVAMVGMGVASNADAAFAVADEERGWGEPDFLGRIVLGMGPESGLITAGIISNAAHCPGGIQNADNVTYNDYNVVLPRLASTVDRMTSTNLPATAIATPKALKAAAYDDEPAASYNIVDQTTNTDNLNLRTRTFDITAAQESYQYATQCPEGHMYPEDDGEFWGIDLLNDNTI